MSEDVLKELFNQKYILHDGFMRLFCFLEGAHPKLLDELLTQCYDEYTRTRKNEIVAAMKVAKMKLHYRTETGSKLVIEQ